MPRNPLARLAQLDAASRVLLVVVLFAAALSFTTPFAESGNLFNISRNLAFVALVAVGQVAVIVTGGIDLSVGSVIGLVAVVTASVMAAGSTLLVAVALGLGTALACGLVNGALVAYFSLPPFVVTLGMLGLARSVAMVLSQNRMLHDLGPDEELLLGLGGGQLLGVAIPVWLVVGLVLVVTWLERHSAFARSLYALGNNERSARLMGIDVARRKVAVYVVSALSAGLCAILMVGWLGAATNALGEGYELRVIAASVIGGAHLSGGVGTAFGALAGAALVEVLRNGLLLAGVDPNWQGFALGCLIILAVLASMR